MKLALSALIAWSCLSGCLAQTGGSSEVATQTDAVAWRFPAAQRVVAIGDVHGDFDVAKRALQLAGAVNESGAWVGGHLVVVQVGDQLDRGKEEREILDWFETLRLQASKSGGAFFPLIGNHEAMNVQLDLRYVSPEGFKQFGEYASLAEADPLLQGFKPMQRGRAAAFRQGGPYAKKLAKNLAVVQIGDTVFVHGGLLPKHVAYGIGRLNAELQKWMRTKTAPTPAFVEDDDSPLWNRSYSFNTGDDDCAMLEAVLAAMDASRMVVAHTVQASGVNSRCEKKVWRIDTGLSAYYGGPLEILEIKDGKAQVLR